MILNEFTSPELPRLKKLTKILAEQYGVKIDYDKLTLNEVKMLKKATIKKLDETRDIQKRLKFRLIAESLSLWHKAKFQTELTSMIAETIDDDSVEEAKVIIAAKNISDKIQGMIEDAAKLQVQELLPIIDAMKTEIGSREAEQFSESADQILGELIEELKKAKESYDDAVRVAQGMEPASDMDDFDDDSIEVDDDIEVDDNETDEEDEEDEFAGHEAASGESEPVGRELKDES